MPRQMLKLSDCTIDTMSLPGPKEFQQRIFDNENKFNSIPVVDNQYDFNKKSTCQFCDMDVRGNATSCPHCGGDLQ